MVRAVLVCAGIAAFLAPALNAQTKVCAFQEKRGQASNGTQSDADVLAGVLNSHHIQTVAAVGIARNDQDAEAEKQGCTWIINLSRQSLTPDTPNYAGTLNSTQGETVGHAVIEGTKPLGDALLEFSLRKVTTHKNVARGEAEDPSAYARVAEQIEKKIAKDK